MINERIFGRLDGREVFCITLSDGICEVELLTYGATIRAIRVPDREGKPTDVCLGYDTLEEYRDNDGYLGASVGRHANRIGGAQFTINSVEYKVAPNEGENQLHGGPEGFSARLWEYTPGENSVTFALTSPDGDQGFPGNFREEVAYTLSDGVLTIDYFAWSDKDTVANLTNHAYFNLGGHDSGPVDGHVVMIHADHYTPVGQGSIPTGEIAPVEGTVFDLRRPVALGDRLDALELKEPNGFDHNFALSGETPGAVVYCPATGIAMEMTTPLEGVQFYTAGFLSARKGKGGAAYATRHGLCLETQHYPDAVNKPNFPSPILRAGEEFRHSTGYRFFAK